jgi:hypothetical protein
MKKPRGRRLPAPWLVKLQGSDLNRRPQGYEPCELPGCSTLRSVNGILHDEEHSWQGRIYSGGKREGKPTSDGPLVRIAAGRYERRDELPERPQGIEAKRHRCCIPLKRRALRREETSYFWEERQPAYPFFLQRKGGLSYGRAGVSRCSVDQKGYADNAG